MDFKLFFIVIGASLLLFVILHRLSNNKRPLRRAFLTMLSGALALAAVDVAGLFTGVYLPLSLFTIAVSLAGGIPGVTALLTLNLIF